MITEVDRGASVGWDGAGDGLTEAESQVKRTALARRIVELAESGIKDADKLRKGAVTSLRPKNLRRN
jgi:hypothetical protein